LSSSVKWYQESVPSLSVEPFGIKKKQNKPKKESFDPMEYLLEKAECDGMAGGVTLECLDPKL
jgi:hypothetical protein